MIQETAPAPRLHVPDTRQIVRVRLRHSSEWKSLVVTIEHEELGIWIDYARRHGFAVEAESIDLPPQGA